MNIGDNVYMIPFDKLDDWYKNEDNRLNIPESDWRELEGKKGIVVEVSDIDDTVLVAFPIEEEREGSSNPTMYVLYFYKDTLEKIPFEQEG